jgi:hypothetical protein
MDNSLLLIIFIAIVGTLIIIQPNTIESKKNIEEMNTEELITDFNLLIENEKAKNGTLQLQKTEPFQNNTPIEKSDYMSEFAKSSWSIYTQAPYYFLKTHPDKPVFYEKKLYRKPYRYPIGYSSTYPINHFNLFEN